MTHHIARHFIALALATGAIAPHAALAAETPATSVAQITAPDARFTLLDADGNPVGTLVAHGNGTLAFREIARSRSASVALPSLGAAAVARALTPQQLDDALRQSNERFFDVLHTP